MGKRGRFVLVGTLVVLLTLIVSHWAIPYYYGWPSASSAPGDFGSMFGFAEALFSGLAFIVIIYSLVQQQHDLGQQQEETNALRFETLFFNMLNIHLRLVHDVSVPITSDPNSPRKDGREAMSFLFQKLKSHLLARESPLSIAETYDQFYSKKEYILGPYFRSLYHLLATVDDSAVNSKKKYTNIIRAHMSNAELCLLYYNCVSDHGKKGMLRLVGRYTLLKHMDQSKLADPADIELLPASVHQDKSR